MRGMEAVQDGAEHAHAVVEKQVARRRGLLDVGDPGTHHQDDPVGVVGKDACVRHVEHRRRVDQHQVKLAAEPREQRGGAWRVQQLRHLLGAGAGGNDGEVGDRG